MAQLRIWRHFISFENENRRACSAWQQRLAQSAHSAQRIRQRARKWRMKALKAAQLASGISSASHAWRHVSCNISMLRFSIWCERYLLSSKGQTAGLLKMAMAAENLAWHERHGAAPRVKRRKLTIMAISNAKWHQLAKR